eukprot:2401896-Prymnesium_polylepis.1
MQPGAGGSISCTRPSAAGCCATPTADASALDPIASSAARSSVYAPRTRYLLSRESKSSPACAELSVSSHTELAGHVHSGRLRASRAVKGHGCNVAPVHPTSTSAAVVTVDEDADAWRLQVCAGDANADVGVTTNQQKEAAVCVEYALATQGIKAHALHLQRAHHRSRRA